MKFESFLRPRKKNAHRCRRNIQTIQMSRLLMLLYNLSDTENSPEEKTRCQTNLVQVMSVGLHFYIVGNKYWVRIFLKQVAYLSKCYTHKELLCKVSCSSTLSQRCCRQKFSCKSHSSAIWLTMENWIVSCLQEKGNGLLLFIVMWNAFQHVSCTLLCVSIVL